MVYQSVRSTRERNFLEEIPTAGSERQDRVCRSESEQERSDGARGDYAEGDDSSDNVRYLYVSDVNEIQDYLKEQNVDYTMPDIPQDSWAATTFLPVILTLVGVFLIFGLMNRQAAGPIRKQ